MEAFMEAFVVEFKEMNDGIKMLKADNKSLNDSVKELKKENVILRGLVDELQEKKSSSTPQDVNVPKIGKIHRKCNELGRAVTSLKEEVNKTKSKVQENSAKIQEDSSRINQLHRVFNTIHVSMQSRKDLEGEIKGIKNDVSDMKNCLPPRAAAPDVPSRDSDAVGGGTATPSPHSQSAGSSRPRSHPSKAGISRREVDRILDFRRKAHFDVTLDTLPIIHDKSVCVDGYDGITVQSDDMDMESGLYTVPVDGRYEFFAGSTSDRRTIYLYLCRDRGNKKIDVLDHAHSMRVTWDCLANDLIWLEARGGTDNTVNTVDKIIFQGTLQEQKE